MDQPTAEQLRDAIAATRATLADRGADEARYLERVAENLEQILERERALLDNAVEATAAAFAAAMPEGVPVASGPMPERVDQLRRALDEALESGRLAPSSELRSILLDDARRRVAICRPGYDDEAT